MGTSQRVTRLPAMALAEYEAGELRHLTPNETADGVETVNGRVESLDEPMVAPEQEGAVLALD